MMKRITLAILMLVVSGFAFEWGIYGGPGTSMTFTNMKPLHSDLSADYDISTIPSFQIGIATPVVLRLWNFTLGGGDSYSWQTASGNDYKTFLHHRIDMFELGYVVDLGDNLRLRPVVGIGDYDIDLRISELKGGFGEPDDGDSDSRQYEYDNTSFVAGASLAYIWKFENRVVVGIEAKARYLVPLEQNVPWEPDDRSYPDVYVDGFYPHTPVVGVNFLIGYEKLEEDRDDEWGEELEDDGWEED
ncbi:hypothetical protein GF359_03215 [candidate division WOR-3 bacterium]|uniref:Outer membrane protein beta-barrel domain-containing protein n=1 Tax=candidate division WOR-3 bacterium TaxID=2052148 RepID=A0A9D5K8U7_UNCW3|nr:hypothetical protein [candidate division WOR-3 bacterium]MBD3364205.1 hypothetical protein [candidate division WOR-3 bacterium]